MNRRRIVYPLLVAGLALGVGYFEGQWHSDRNDAAKKPLARPARPTPPPPGVEVPMTIGPTPPARVEPPAAATGTDPTAPLPPAPPTSPPAPPPLPPAPPTSPPASADPAAPGSGR